ncbi:cytochrome P450 [Streptomyces sp. NPDC005727]|uniref:cytochrome P450 n=1 Tax=Streptomyces sp. NPDC005727 TaxID=3157053 RepID=UPI0033C2A887
MPVRGSRSTPWTCWPTPPPGPGGALEGRPGCGHAPSTSRRPGRFRHAAGLDGGVRVIHRDPVVYPEPARFDPYRWSTEQRTSIPRHAYQPFGGGARQCIGENFAWSEMTVILAEITKRSTLAESGVVPRMVPRGDDPPGPDRRDSPYALRRLGEGGTVTAPTRLTVPPLYCPLPSAMHPDAAEIGRRSIDCLAGLGLFAQDGVRAQMVRTRAAEGACRIAPRGERHRLQIVSDWTHLGFAVDGHRFDTGTLADRPEVLIPLMMRLMPYLDHQEGPGGDDPFSIGFRHLSTRARGGARPPGWCAGGWRATWNGSSRWPA